MEYDVAEPETVGTGLLGAEPELELEGGSGFGSFSTPKRLKK